MQQRLLYASSRSCVNTKKTPIKTQTNVCVFYEALSCKRGLTSLFTIIVFFIVKKIKRFLTKSKGYRDKEICYWSTM